MKNLHLPYALTPFLIVQMVRARANPIDYPFAYWFSVVAVLGGIVYISYYTAKKTIQ
jgi:lipid-A-disaccharide synthase-like uncharacterized protein